MSNRLDDPQFAGQGPSASYAFERDRMIHAGATEEAAHAAGLLAHEVSVYGADAKKDRNGHRIQQGIGSPGHETGNYFASIRRYEGEIRYQAAIRKMWKDNPERAKLLGLEQPERLGA